MKIKGVSYLTIVLLMGVAVSAPAAEPVDKDLIPEARTVLKMQQ